MKATKSDGRVCSFCKKPGHNARTCPDKQKSDARAARKTEQSESTALTTVGASTEGSEATILPATARASGSTTPLEFEEWTKQVVVPSQGHAEKETTLRATLSDYDNGVLSDVRLTIQEAGSRAAAPMRLDMNIIEKLNELLTTVIQRDRARRSQKQLGASTAHVNGKATTATA